MVLRLSPALSPSKNACITLTRKWLEMTARGRKSLKIAKSGSESLKVVAILSQDRLTLAKFGFSGLRHRGRHNMLVSLRLLLRVFWTG